MTASMTYKKKSYKRGGDYKIVFKPSDYEKSLAHHNADWENGPLLPWKNNTMSRCYYLVNNANGALNGKIVWAAIYKMNDAPGDLPIAVYTTQNAWNNDVTKKYKEQDLPVHEYA